MSSNNQREYKTFLDRNVQMNSFAQEYCVFIHFRLSDFTSYPIYDKNVHHGRVNPVISYRSTVHY
jgi:hypothetical protein